MSSTGGWVYPACALEAGVTELKRWREASAEGLGAFRRWALLERLIDEQAAARLSHLERRLAAERLTIAFVAESSRGKGELINALFFADFGAPLLPSGTGRAIRCPLEIRWDAARPPCIRLLPSEEPASTQALRESIEAIDTWKKVALDPTKPETLASACAVLCVPRWRYAIVNIPHPLLESGLAILYLPGREALELEPELTLNRLPDAAAMVFVLAADTGANGADRDLWADHIAPIGGIEKTCFIVLNKIDGLRDAAKTDSQVLSEIDQLVRSTAETFGVAPTRIFALSARQAWAAKIAGDRDNLLKSRLYRLEQALSRGIVHERRLSHAIAARAEVRAVFGQSRALIDSRLTFTHQQLEELNALQGKNQKLVETLAKKAGLERARLEQARAVMAGLRTVHHRHLDALVRLLDPREARESAMRARAAVGNSAFSSGIGETLDAYFARAREKLREAIEVIEEAKKMMLTVNRKFVEDYQIPTAESADFATARFLAELDRLEERCARDFRGTSKLLMRRGTTLGALFFDTVALNVIHIFEIADREARTWMGGFIRPLEAQLEAAQEQANSRIEGMGRIQNAESDLLVRLEELKGAAGEAAALREQWQAHHERVFALLDVERESSLV